MEVSPSVFILKDDDDDDDWVCLIKHFLEDFDDSHATSPWTLPGQELSSILWSFASFVVAPRADIVSDFCETLVQRTGSWAGGWKLKGFNLCTLTFSFSAFCWIDYVTT